MPTKEEIVTFSLLIEDVAEKKKVSYIEAIIIQCEASGLEIELAAKLISPNLKSKLEVEAGSLNLITMNTHARLPL
jgi:hypothetical protein